MRKLRHRRANWHTHSHPASNRQRWDSNLGCLFLCSLSIKFYCSSFRLERVTSLKVPLWAPVVIRIKCQLHNMQERTFHSGGVTSTVFPLLTWGHLSISPTGPTGALNVTSTLSSLGLCSCSSFCQQRSPSTDPPLLICFMDSSASFKSLENYITS